jgi:hypothetical protein
MVTEPELAENKAVWDATEASFKALLTGSASKLME